MTERSGFGQAKANSENLQRERGDVVDRVTFSPNGTWIASGSAAGYVAIWDANTEISRLLHGHVGQVIDVQFSPCSKFLWSVGMDRTVRVWSVDSGLEVAIHHMQESAIQCLSICPDGSRGVIGGSDHHLRIIDSKQQRAKLESQESYRLIETKTIRAIDADARSSQFAIISGDRELIIASHDKNRLHIDSRRNWIDVAYSRSKDSFLSLSNDGTLGIVPADGSADMNEVSLGSMHCLDLAVGNNGKDIAISCLVADEKHGKIMLLDHDMQVRGVVDCDRPVCSIAISPNGELIAGMQCRDQTIDSESSITVWAASDSKCKGMVAIGEQPTTIAFDQDNRLVVGTDHGSVRVFASDLREAADASLPRHPTLSPAIPTAQGRAEGTNESAGRLSHVWTSQIHAGGVVSMGILAGPNSSLSRCATAGKDGVVAICELQTGHLLFRLETETEIRQVMYRESSDSIVVIDAEGAVRFFMLIRC